MSVSKEVIRSLRIKFLIEVEQNPDKYHQKDVERVKTNDWWIERFVLVNNTEDLALQNFIKTMEWRKSLGVNDLTDHSFPQKFYKIGLVSICPIKDKEGRSVLWAKANRMGKSGFTPLFQSFIVYLLEKMDSQVTNQGWALVVDTTGFGLSNVDVDLSKFLIDVYQNHYPRSLKYIAVIDLPWILNAISKVIMTFMDEELRNIVNFISKQELIQYIDSQHIPVQLNGLQGQRDEEVTDVSGSYRLIREGQPTGQPTEQAETSNEPLVSPPRSIASRARESLQRLRHQMSRRGSLDLPEEVLTHRTEMQDWEQKYQSWTDFEEETKLHSSHKRFLKEKGFTLGPMIGEGGFGQVFRVTQKMSSGEKRHLACKVVSFGRFKPFEIKGATEVVTQEAEVYRHLNHTNIVKREHIFQFFHTKTHIPVPMHVVILMELMEGNLYRLIFESNALRLSEQKCNVWFKQIVSGLAYMHGHNVVHLDIKPLNILYSSRLEDDVTRFTFKLTDFGLALRFQPTQDNKVTGLVGTRRYRAPEMEEGATVDARPADIYSLGISLVDSIGGNVFSPQYIMSSAINWNENVRHRIKMSEGMAQVIQRCTDADPDNRPTVEQLEQNNWVKNAFPDYYEAYYGSQRL